jgi:hypothetical protein
MNYFFLSLIYPVKNLVTSLLISIYEVFNNNNNNNTITSVSSLRDAVVTSNKVIGFPHMWELCVCAADSASSGCARQGGG